MPRTWRTTYEHFYLAFTFHLCKPVYPPNRALRCRRGKDKWRKEVHFFDQWPLGSASDYINCFPQDRRVAALALTTPAVFVDASPEYLLTPAAAPRAAQIIPHAKIVIILRVRFRRLFSVLVWTLVFLLSTLKISPSRSKMLVTVYRVSRGLWQVCCADTPGPSTHPTHTLHCLI